MFEKVKQLTESCSCGKKHTLMTEEFAVEKDAHLLMAEYLKKHGYTSPAVICDENTHVFTHDITKSIDVKAVLTVSGKAHATEVFAADAEDFIRKHFPDVLIACGSGSVHDITRYAAHTMNVPFVSYPTAASVDGYVSGVAAMTWYGQKLTFEAVPPKAVFASPEVFATAPERLTASGVGDVLGKYNSLFDWNVGRIFTGEYYCPEIAAITREAVDETVEAIKRRADISKEEYTTKVMYALLLSGLAMQLAGNSRPASGAEHHMSHLWEMHLMNEEVNALHGEKVAVGLNIVADTYKKALTRGLDYDKIGGIELEKVFAKGRISPVFAELTEPTLKENLPDGTLSSSSLAKIKLDDIDRINKELAEAASILPEADEIINLCTLADVPVKPSDVGLPSDEEFIKKSLKYAPYVRNRITLLKILSAADII